jgi:hypothetical protein
MLSYRNETEPKANLNPNQKISNKKVKKEEFQEIRPNWEERIQNNSNFFPLLGFEKNKS